MHHVWEENLMRYPCLSHHLHLQSRFDTQDPDLLPRALVQDIGARTTRTLETLQQRLEGVQHSVVVAFCVSKLWAMSSAQLPSVSNAPADSTSSWVLHRSRTPLSRDRRGDVLFERRFGSVLEESSGGRGGRIHAQMPKHLVVHVIKRVRQLSKHIVDSVSTSTTPYRCASSPAIDYV